MTLLVRLFNVFEQEHVLYFGGGARVEPGFLYIVFGVPEGSEQDIKKGEIGVVVGMNTFGMVNRVAFRSLNDVSQPDRGFDIGVLKDAEEIADQQNDGYGLGRQAHDEGEAEGAEQGKPDHIKWTEIEGPIGIQSFGAMMHLMEYAPEPVVPVHASVPYIHSQFIQENAQQGGQRHVHAGEVQEWGRGHPARVEQGQIGGQVKEQKEPDYSLDSPVFYLRQRSGREGGFPNHQKGIHTQNAERDGVEQDVNRRNHGHIFSGAKPDDKKGGYPKHLDHRYGG